MSATMPAASKSEKTFVKGGSFLIQTTAPADVFTPEDFTEEQLMIGKTTNDFIQNEVMPLLPQLEKQSQTQNFDLTVSLIRKAGELGLLAGDIPAKYEGLELDKVCSMLMAEGVGVSGGFSVSIGGHTGIGTWPITFFGTPEQKAKYLPKLGTGELLAAYALSEPGSGSDALGARTRAVLSEDGKHYILNGSKMWITNAGFADIFIVFCKIDGDKFSCFIVPRDSEGLSTGKEEDKMGIHSSSTRLLILENVKVPVENLLGQIGKGHFIAFNCLNMGRFKLGASCCGASKAIIKHAVKYSSERHQFGKPIASFGAIKHKLSEMLVQTFATESMAYRAAGLIDQRLTGVDADDVQEIMDGIEEYAIECSIMKVYGSEAMDFCADEAVQIFGGYGFSEEYPVARFYRDSRINRIFEGTNEINRLLIPGMLLKKAMKGELPLMQAVKKIMDEVMSLPSFGEDEEETLFSLENKLVENAKKAGLFVAGVAVQKYMQKLNDQQEILMAISDITMDIYAMESMLLRTLKQVSRIGEAKSRDMIDATRIYINDAIGRIEQNARRVLPSLAEGDDLRMYLSVLKRYTKYTPINTITLRQRLADRALETGGYMI